MAHHMRNGPVRAGACSWNERSCDSILRPPTGVGIQRSLFPIGASCRHQKVVSISLLILSIRFIIDIDTDCEFGKYAMILRIYGRVNSANNSSDFS